MSVEDVRDETVGLIVAAETEATTLFDELVVPTWGTDRHGWPRTLYGHIMGAFSLLDRVSQLASGDRTNQTRRMVWFAASWLQYDRMLSGVAVHMWRHSLMHTGEPQRLIDSRGPTTWRWLLHWGSHLPREHHLTESGDAQDRILNFALLYFLQDLHKGASEWFRSIAPNTPDAESVLLRHARLKEFKVALR